MPLHLLSKKSWNVYNPASIARVRADEAAYAAREEAANELELEWQASCRLAKLRGLPEPARHKELDDVDVAEDGGEVRRQERAWEREDRKRKRRRVGEDESERDIRVAREDLEGTKDGERRRGMGSERRQRDGKDKGDLPLVDKAGHIQLFAPSEEGQGSRSDTKRSQDPTQSLRQQQQADREYGSLRFSQAGADRSNPTSRPWYAGPTPAPGPISISRSGYSGTETLDNKNMLLAGESTGRDVWGNEDPGRKSRDAVRTAAADPMAMMQMAQRKLKQVERERKMWKKTREAEVGSGRDMLAHGGLTVNEEGRHRHARRDRSRSKERSPRRKHRHHRDNRHRSRSPDDRERRRHHDRNYRARRDRDREAQLDPLEK